MEIPDVVLADVLLRVLQPQHLAACRRVCANWRRVIDGHKLLLPHLLPAAPRGIFINYTARDGWSDVGYFSRGILDGTIDTRLGFAPLWNAVIDHCNGLLLCTSEETCFVYNPVTWRSAQLRAPPGAQGANWGIGSAAYLVFDPAVSLHFQVFLLPDQLPEMPEPPVPVKSSPPPFNVGRLFMAGAADGDLWPEVDTDDDDGEDWFMDSQEDETRPHYHSSEHSEVRDAMGLMEWPPLVYVVQVFSSVTGQWSERTFVRKSDPAGTVADMWPDSSSIILDWSPATDWSPRAQSNWRPRRRYTVYWQQFLYIQCRAGFIMRFSVMTEEYQVIQSPRIVSPYNWWEKPITYLGKSKKGVYYTATDYLKLRVWLLTEETEASRGALPVWAMIHNADLEPPLSQLSHENCEEKDKSWILDHEKAVQTEQGYREWDSDNDDRFVSNDEQHDDDDENDDYADGDYMTMSSLDLLGYHPHKEIILLGSREVGNGCAFA
ncbi:unnamed protein product [Triticum turgidum subsp. durum]|uniref:F-box domain-containing protein n=1 Tax=Triticum turgidum subsp. durum TaxID=4567 RepID=A0A9R0WX09_TRITD|nr:unnamed protein product [Triticum turgidum subsp. durum]